jgi:hypothetical protein
MVLSRVNQRIYDAAEYFSQVLFEMLLCSIMSVREKEMILHYKTTSFPCKARAMSDGGTDFIGDIESYKCAEIMRWIGGEYGILKNEREKHLCRK